LRGERGDALVFEADDRTRNGGSHPWPLVQDVFRSRLLPRRTTPWTVFDCLFVPSTVTHFRLFVILYLRHSPMPDLVLTVSHRIPRRLRHLIAHLDGARRLFSYNVVFSVNFFGAHRESHSETHLPVSVEECKQMSLHQRCSLADARTCPNPTVYGVHRTRCLTNFLRPPLDAAWNIPWWSPTVTS
uniref:Apple domain-containing protein n=1 Tax=Haemonchus placei TaxID=6290 RepID=A0A0N4WE62_HAEPC